jgi:hypothetical protein
LEAEVVKYLTEKGYHIESAPYHKIFSDTMQKALHTNFDVNGIYVRSRADRVIIHDATGFACQLEVKTPRYARQKREQDILFLEALPLAIHIYSSRIGIKTLYVYENPRGNCISAFWAGDKIVRYIKEIRIPPKQGVNRSYYEQKIKQILGDNAPQIVKTRYPPRGGSGDPYAVVDLHAIRSDPDARGARTMLKEAIDEYMAYRPLPIHIHCGSCNKVVDWSDTRLCSNGCGHVITVACMCATCYTYFCGNPCYANHLDQTPSCKEMQADPIHYESG